MRVIAGEFGRRKLEAPRGATTRPTPDRMREALFSMLASQIEGAIFTDLYAGSGAVGIEALSRGAARVVFVETDRDALETLKRNVKSLGIERRTETIAKPVRKALERRMDGIVFVDPPYGAEAEYEHCLAHFGASPPALLLIQHDRRLKLPEISGKLSLQRQLKQGDNRVSFYLPDLGATGIAGA